jgi:molybdate transport system regulatory protein
MCFAPVSFLAETRQRWLMPRLTIRIDFDDGSALGPGKIRLLELVAETGSIRKAAAGMKMSYRKAWLLLKALNETFGQPLVETTTGGKSGGGARLTRLGRFVVTYYRALEGTARRAGGPAVDALNGRLRAGTRKKVRLRRRIRA